MSARNTLAAKAARRADRQHRKALAARHIRHHGVVVRKSDVLSHRYLWVHKLPYSPAIAAVHITPVLGRDRDAQA